MLKVGTSNSVAGRCGAPRVNKIPQRNRLSWARLPDDDTQYSDWQIDVQFVGSDTGVDEKTFSYLVHRFAIGPQSTYFSVAFDDNNGFSESRQRRSMIQLPADRGITRDHFESLLDFLYDDYATRHLTLDADKALAMLYLADYFGIETAKEQIKKFFLSKLKSSSCSGLFLAQIYSMAEFLSMEELQDAVARTKFRRSLKLGELQDALTNSTRVDNVPLFFPSFLTGLDRPELKRECLHRMCRMRRESRDNTSTWSALISCSIVDSPDVVDKDLFSELTGKQVMPHVETLHAAVVILKHEKLLDLDKGDELGLTCLQKRCTKAIYDELWKRKSFQLWRLIYPTPEEVLDKLRGLKPTVVRTVEYNGPPRKRSCTR